LSVRWKLQLDLEDMMAEKKLWTVAIEVEIVVLAEDEARARMVARDAPFNKGVGSEDLRVTPMSYLPKYWDLYSIPFAARPYSDKNVKELVEAGAAPEYENRAAFLAKKRAEADARKKEP
jgi:hypothetical protein